MQRHARRLHRSFGTLLSAALVTVAAVHAQPDFAPQYRALAENREGLSDSARLHRLFELDWEYGMATYPEWATWEGRNEFNDRLTDNSYAAIKKREKDAEMTYDVLRSINRDKLSDLDQLNYDLYMYGADRTKRSVAFEGELMPVNQLGGVHQDAPQLFREMPQKTIKDYQNILARMRAMPTVIDNDIALMKMGLEKGITPPRVTLRDVPQQVLNILNDEPLESPIMAPFEERPESISEQSWNDLRDEGVRIYTESLAPAFRRLHDFLEDTYLPKARESVGMGAMPGGKEWYAFNVEGYTTTMKTPDEIFEIGLTEVARIRSKMDSLIDVIDFDGSYAEFCTFLQTDPQFYYTSAEELLAGYRDICKKADPELIKLFGHLPRMPYGVIPVPSYAEKSQTTAYYSGGSHEAGRPAYFYANTYDLKSRPKWEMEALALHEAVPGHHLQVSIADELDDLPHWRQGGGYTAYVEGWGLYAESLGEEMGFYEDPYSKFGQLTYELWRAIRLVVDVGLHYKGWTRQQAIDYFTENSCKTGHDVEVEVDRYIVWPGQALAYKIGEMKIKELRRYAENTLGEAFDIRAFHDEVLGDGALPLDVLEKKIKTWVKGQMPKSRG